jgi:hypothetical protein
LGIQPISSSYLSWFFRSNHIQPILVFLFWHFQPHFQETPEACSPGLFEAFRVDLSADSAATWQLVASMA